MSRISLSSQEHAHILVYYLEQISQQVLVLLDADLTILDCNRGFQHLVGQKEKPLGRNLREFLYLEEDFNCFASPIDFAMIRDGSLHGEALQGVKLRVRGESSSVYTLTVYLFQDNGHLLLFGEKPYPLDREIIEKMSILNNELAELTRQLNQKNRELEKANKTITRLMNTDPLTGLANRRYFQEVLHRAISFAARQDNPLSLVMADLDYFKAINDRFGHNQGDRVLVAFARLLQDHSRTEDLPVRFGGEEFIILLPGTGPKEAVAFAERIRKAVLALRFEGGPLGISASFGVTGFSAGDTQDTLIQKADTALYQAKKEGRNRIILWEEMEHTKGKTS